LLLIGDAAHTMSPICAVGINYAIHDAVAATNELTGPLRTGRVEVRHLAAVQRQRQWPTKVMQAIQAILQKRALASIEEAREKPFQPGLPVRILRCIPWVRDLPVRLIHLGFRRMRLKEPAAAPTAPQEAVLVRSSEKAGHSLFAAVPPYNSGERLLDARDTTE
jgi:hypothetical protein